MIEEGGPGRQSRGAALLNTTTEVAWHHEKLELASITVENVIAKRLDYSGCQYTKYMPGLMN